MKTEPDLEDIHLVAFVGALITSVNPLAWGWCAIVFWVPKAFLAPSMLSWATVCVVIFFATGTCITDYLTKKYPNATKSNDPQA